MGLPIKKLPVPHLPEPIPGMSSNPGPSHVTPSSLLAIKREKLDHDAYVDPLSPTRHGKKRKDVEHSTPSSSKRFATKLDFQQTFTPSKQREKLSHLQLFLPPGKSAVSSVKEDNTLDTKSSEYVTSISCVKHNLIIAAHQFLFEKTPKDYINKIWAVIEKFDILIEK